MATWWTGLAIAWMAAGCGDNIEPFGLQLALDDGCVDSGDGSPGPLTGTLTVTNTGPTEVDANYALCTLDVYALDTEGKPMGIVSGTGICTPYSPPITETVLLHGEQVSQWLVIWEFGRDPRVTPGTYTLWLESVEMQDYPEIGLPYGTSNRTRVVLPDCTPG